MFLAEWYISSLVFSSITLLLIKTFRFLKLLTILTMFISLSSCSSPFSNNLSSELVDYLLQQQQILFPLAAVGLCDTYHSLHIYANWSLKQALDKCRPLLQQALAQQPELGQAMAAQAEALLRQASAKSTIGRFQIEAAIQSVHAARARSGQTD